MKAMDNGNRYLRRQRAYASPIYQQLLKAAKKRLKAHGYFSKADVLEDTLADVVGDSIRWDYFFEFAEEEFDIKLLKVAERFFKTYDKDASGKRVRTDEDRQVNPSKYLATGHGKKTAGYVLAEIDDGVLAVKLLYIRNEQAVGKRKATDDLEKNLIKRKLIPRQKRIAKK